RYDIRGHALSPLRCPRNRRGVAGPPHILRRLFTSRSQPSWRMNPSTCSSNRRWRRMRLSRVLQRMVQAWCQRSARHSGARAGARAGLPRRGGSCPRRIRSVRELRRAHRCRAAGGATYRDSLRALSGGVGAGQPLLIQPVSGLKALRERRYLMLAQLVDDEARVEISKPVGNPPRVVSAKLARARNYFCYDAVTDAPRLLQALRRGACRNAWHVMPACEPEGKESDQCSSKTRPLRVAVWRKSGIRASSRLSMS